MLQNAKSNQGKMMSDPSSTQSGHKNWYKAASEAITEKASASNYPNVCWDAKLF